MRSVRHTSQRVLVVVWALIVLPVTPARAAAGDLDPSFGGGGIVTTRVVPGETSGTQALAIRPDGTIVAAGGTQTVVTAFRARRCVVGNAVAAPADGTIVVAGGAGCRGRFALVRYRANGTLDPTFGGDGRVTTGFRGGRFYSTALGVAVQSDGKVVAVGICCHHSVFAVARYDLDGSLDPTFGGDGRVTTDFTPAGDHASSLAIQADGKIVVAGVAAVARDRARFAVARYDTDGTLDATFGGDGRVTTQPEDCVSQARGVTVQTDGRIVVAGSAGCIDEFGVVRYDTGGTLDPTFDGDGIVTTGFSGCPQATPNALAIGADGRIVVSGFEACAGPTSEHFAFATARYDMGGSLDGSFGTGGQVTSVIWDPECFQQATGVAVQSDGNIVVAGGTVCEGARHTRFTAVRYLGA
jgi:serralysin